MSKSKFRKHLLILMLSVFATWPVSLFAQQHETATSKRYRVAVCDWMMLKRQKLGAFQLAYDIHADGVEMDMGPLGQRWTFDNRFHEPEECNQFRHTADSLGIVVPSIAMSGFFAQNLLTRSNYMVPIADCLHTMSVFGSQIAFLPLGGSGHGWKEADSSDRHEMVRRLHAIGEMAQAEGKVIAIRTALNAKESLRLLKEINSDGIKVYYNLQDAVDQGLDPCREIKRLGARNIAQIHASLTDSVTLDQDTRINLYQLKRTLDAMHWSGWLVVERSRNAKDVRNVRGNFGTNVAYLKKIFQQ